MATRPILEMFDEPAGSVGRVLGLSLQLCRTGREGCGRLGRPTCPLMLRTRSAAAGSFIFSKKSEKDNGAGAPSPPDML